MEVGKDCRQTVEWSVHKQCAFPIWFDSQNHGILSVTIYLVLKSLCNVMSCSSICYEDSVKMLFTGSPLVQREFGNQYCMKPFHVTHIDQLCHMGVSKGLLFYSRYVLYTFSSLSTQSCHYHSLKLDKLLLLIICVKSISNWHIHALDATFLWNFWHSDGMLDTHPPLNAYRQVLFYAWVTFPKMSCKLSTEFPFKTMRVRGLTPSPCVVYACNTIVHTDV